MKMKTAMLGSAMIFATAMAVADEKHHEGTQAKGAPESGGMMQEGGMPMMDMKTMEEHMEKMQATLDKAKSAKDPKERQVLLQDHMKEMNAGMGMMNKMSGMMMSQPSGGAMGGGPKMEPDSKQMQQQHESMQQRMSMMQKMMEHMMAQQALMMEE